MPFLDLNKILFLSLYRQMALIRHKEWHTLKVMERGNEDCFSTQVADAHHLFTDRKLFGCIGSLAVRKWLCCEFLFPISLPAGNVAMTLSVWCPYCGRKANSNASSIGTLKRCPQCRRQYEVSAPAIPSRPKRKPFSGLIGCLGLAAVGIFGMVCCGGFGGSRSPHGRRAQ